MVVNTETLEANPALGKALVGAWYETMSIMSKDDEAGRAARTAMGKASGTDLAGYDAQLASTKMFFEPAEAVAFAKSEQLPLTMEEVASFSFDHGLLGEGAPNPGFIGVAFPGERYFGDPGNLKLRFDADFMQMAADGAL
jgi:NitT/TauT family transport system substrate-binding protein